MFSFTIDSKLKDTFARAGHFQTNFHNLETPELAIVATEGEFKAIPREYWKDLPCKYVIVNTFHISTKQSGGEKGTETILERIDTQQGIHSYMDLKDRTISSDSGGFQVFSLGFGKAHGIGKVANITGGEEVTYDDKQNPLSITEEGVSFEFDGKTIHLTPEISMDIQHKIGADMMFAFDECTSPFNSKEYTEKSLERTFRWLDRCITAHKGYEQKQALFPIIQGGVFEDLRKKSAKEMGAKNVPGFGIGGSFGKQDLYTVLEWIMPYLPEGKPKHLLGIGTVPDIFNSVERGVDLFDCVIPTREARHRVIYTHRGRLSLRKMKTVAEILDSSCNCFACRDGVTYEQLWKLFAKRDPKATFYASVHNIWFFSDLMKKIRNSIHDNTFFTLKEEYLTHF